METPKIIPPLSPALNQALENELEDPKYKEMDEDTAHYEAAKKIYEEESQKESSVFDLTNPADNLLIALVQME